MNQGLPKPIQEALARQTAGNVHPTADALTAFVEHSLPQLESQRITDHLAQCADCREVVFLASNAAEETAGEQQELMPATAVPQISPALLAKNKEVAAEASPHHGWRLRWVWVSTVAAVLVVSGVVFQKRSELGRSAQLTIASKEPAPVTTRSQEMSAATPMPGSETKVAPESKPVLAPPKPLAKSVRAQTEQVRNAEALAAGQVASGVLEQSAPAAAGIPQPASPPPPAVLFGGAKSAPAAPRTHNTFVESEEQNTTALSFAPRPSMEKPLMTTRAATALHPQWRVTSDGHLERSTTPGNWTPVLADQPATFRVVSVVGNNVWAGGSGGALFHSSDGGQKWSKVSLASPAGAETGTIISIQFSDPALRDGVVTTDGGSRWSTSDAGVTWTKE